MVNDSTARKSCSASHPCNSPRVCPWCARRRQGRVADVAEIIAYQQRWMLSTVITPDYNTPEAVAAARDEYTSGLAAADAGGGVWSVEIGRQLGRLHCHVISRMPLELPPNPRDTAIYSEIIKIQVPSDIRPAAAYIAKQRQMPTPDEYSGRLIGGWGLQHIAGVMLSREMLDYAPVVAAELAEQVLDPHRRERLASGDFVGGAVDWPTVRRLAAVSRARSDDARATIAETVKAGGSEAKIAETLEKFPALARVIARARFQKGVGDGDD